MTRIKICGITNLADARNALDLGAWALGFIFYKKSPRAIEPSKARLIIEALPKNILTVGVFVDEQEHQILDIARACSLKAIQFHGHETPIFCAKFKSYQTIKAFRVQGSCLRNEILKYKTDYYLFDTFRADQAGGTGKVFDWSILNALNIPSAKIILSGGLNPDNIAQAVEQVKAYAYDASSGVEKRPGKKCKRLLKKMFKTINVQ